jgi:hypothetical protein
MVGNCSYDVGWTHDLSLALKNNMSSLTELNLSGKNQILIIFLSPTNPKIIQLRFWGQMKLLTRLLNLGRRAKI